MLTSQQDEAVTLALPTPNLSPVPPAETSGGKGAHETIGRGGLGLAYRNRMGKAILSESTGGQLRTGSPVEQSLKKPAGLGDTPLRMVLLRTEQTPLLHK